jgi:streptogramin lyase
MHFFKRMGLILLFICLMVPVLYLTAVAETVPLQEADLYASGEAAGVYTSGAGDVFVVDTSQELWRVNPATGAYQSFYPLGWESLADIALLPGDSLWWADAGTAFGSFNLATYQAQAWFVDDLNPGGEPLNLGPLVYQGGKPWLASWYGPMFGLFSFNPPTRELCLHAFPSGLFATDLAVHGGLLWALDWRSGSADSLFSMDPANGRLVRYDTGRDVQMFANLVSDGALFWWAEDKLNSAVVRFNPATGAMTTFNLPAGTHPRNLSLRGGKVWFTDKTGKFGWLDPSTAAGTTSTLSGQVLADSITPECAILAAPNSFTISPQSGTFSWSNINSTASQPLSGVGVYSLPAGAEPYGIAGTTDYVWVSDPGRQKLVRMPLEPPEVGYITLVKVVNGGPAGPNDFNLTLNGAPVSSGVAVEVAPGTYTAGETLLTGYTFNGFSGACNASGQMTITAGQSLTCTLTNTYQSGPGEDYRIFLPLILK